MKAKTEHQLTYKKYLTNLIADALDFAGSKDGNLDVFEPKQQLQKKPTPFEGNPQRMEILLVLTIEFLTGAGVVLATSWLLTASDITAVLYWFYEYVFGIIALLFLVLWLTLTYNASQIQAVLLSAQAVSVLGHNCILCSVVVLYIGFAVMGYEADESRWIMAALLEPGFQYQSLELIHAIQFIATTAFVVIMLIGFVFVRAQFISAIQPILQDIEIHNTLHFCVAQTLNKFSFAVYLRFWCVFNVIFQEYLLNVLSRVCDDLVECKFNVAIIPVPGNSDIMVMFAIYCLCFVILECLVKYNKNHMTANKNPHDTTPFVLGTVSAFHLLILAFFTYFYLPKYIIHTETFNTILFLLAFAATLTEIVPHFMFDTCQQTVNFKTHNKKNCDFFFCISAGEIAKPARNNMTAQSSGLQCRRCKTWNVVQWMRTCGVCRDEIACRACNSSLSLLYQCEVCDEWACNECQKDFTACSFCCRKVCVNCVEFSMSLLGDEVISVICFECKASCEDFFGSV